MNQLTAPANGREPHTVGAISAASDGGQLTAISLSSASQAALAQALEMALELAETAGLDVAKAGLIRTAPDEIGRLRIVLELVLQHMVAGNAPAATVVLQQVLGPAFALDQNQLTLDTASVGARDAQIAYQAIAPAGAADPHYLTDVGQLHAWAGAAEQAAVAYDDLVTRLKERIDLVSRNQ
jgi:hypothetical protein